MEKLDSIEHNTHMSRDGGYNNEDNARNMERIIELLEKLLELKN